MRFYFVIVVLLLLQGVFGVPATKASEVQQNPPIDFVPVAQRFAIADFDGDVRPDFATVQSGQSDSGNTNYWVQLRLSRAGRQVVQVNAPAGGLLIQAIDVNGDHAVDLVLATAWFNRPVAILLNDGHGNFSQVEPAKFPAVFAQSGSRWTSASDQFADTLGLPAGSRTIVCLQASGAFGGRSRNGRISSLHETISLRWFFVYFSQRGPPIQNSVS